MRDLVYGNTALIFAGSAGASSSPGDEHQGEYPSQWAAITSMATKIGCSAQTLRSSIHRPARDTGQRPGMTTDERARLQALERENKELLRANEILRKASAYFAPAEAFPELDRRGTS